MEVLKMKLYLLTESDEEAKDNYDNMIFGVFGTKKKAKNLKDKLNANFKQHRETMRARIISLELDTVTEDYNFIINN